MKKVAFSDILSFQKKSQIKAGGGNKEGKYPFYTSSTELTKKIDVFLFDKTSLIFGTGGQASIHYCNERFSVSTDCLVTQAKNIESVNLKYVFYYLSGHIRILEEGFKGAGLKHISKVYISQIPIPLPPLETQKKIAAILDKADELRRNDQKILEKYDQLTQSVFLEMFGDTKLNPKGWEIKKIEELSEEIIDCPHSTPKYVDYKSEYPCIRTTELRNGYIAWESMKYLDEKGYELRTKRLKPQPGDIVYGREGSFGEAAIIPDNTKMSLGQRVMLFRPKYEIINNSYFLTALRSQGLYEQALKKTNGSTVGHINIKDIRKFICPVPPINIQNRFAEIIKQIKTQKQFTQKSLQKSEGLFQSLLQKAFRGGLV